MLVGAALLAACSRTPAPSQSSPPAAAAPAPSAAPAAGARVEWAYYGANLASQHYSPLEQINAANVSKLEVAWRFNTANYGPKPESRNETTPLMIGGVLYTAVGTTRNVVAVDPKSGELLWVWRPNDGDARYKAAPRKTSGRGLVALVRRRGPRPPVRRDAGVLSRGARSRHGPARARLRRERRRRSHDRRARRGHARKRASATARRRW